MKGSGRYKKKKKDRSVFRIGITLLVAYLCYLSYMDALPRYIYLEHAFLWMYGMAPELVESFGFYIFYPANFLLWIWRYYKSVHYAWGLRSENSSTAKRVGKKRKRKRS